MEGAKDREDGGKEPIETNSKVISDFQQKRFLGTHAIFVTESR